MQIAYGRNFVKHLNRSPKHVRLAVVSRLQLFVNNPQHPLLHNHALVGIYHAYRSINITGDWRAIYQEIDGKTAYFIAIGTHSQLYR